ncbi:MAG TPA: response regulator, partial [Beijerinckiaceae bacterium]
VTTAEDGAAAVEAARRAAFDLALIDLQMPGLDGLGAAAAMRALERPPAMICALTAQVCAETRAAAREVGMAQVLNKPFEERDLAALLAQAASGQIAPSL